MPETPKELTKDEARALLPEGEEVHTFRDSVSGGVQFLIGADISRESLLSKIEKYPCFRSGPGATGMGHGLCIRDIEDSPLFVQTEPDEDDEDAEEAEEDDGSQE